MKKRMKVMAFGVGGLVVLALVSTQLVSRDSENLAPFDQALTKSGFTDFYYVDRLKMLALWLVAEMNRLAAAAEDRETAGMSARLSTLIADEIKREDIPLALQAIEAVKKNQQDIAFLLAGRDNFQERVREQFKAVHEHYRSVYGKLMELKSNDVKEFLELGNPRLFALTIEEE